MKILKILLILFFLLTLVGGVGVFIFIKNFDINNYKDKITYYTSKALNREVSLGEINVGFNWRRGLTMKLDKFSIADDARYNQQPLFHVDSILFDVDWKEYAKNKKLIIKKVEIVKPSISIVQSNEGKLNVHEFIKPDKKEETEPSRVTVTTELNFEEDVDLTIESIALVDGTLTYKSIDDENPMEINVGSINVSISNVNDQIKFPVNVAAAIFGSQKNIDLNGNIGIDRSAQSIELTDLTLDVDINKIDLEKLANEIPSLKAANLKALEGKLKFSLNEIVASNNGLTPIVLKGSLKDGGVNTKDLPYPLENISMKMEVVKSDLTINDLSMTMASGVISGKGDVKSIFEEQKFTMSIDIDKFNVRDFIEDEKIKSRVQGTIVGKLNVQGQGFDSKALTSSMTGAGDFQIENAKLIGDNITFKTIDKIDEVPLNVISALVNTSGQLSIPFKSYRGPIEKFKSYPDVATISKQVGRQELKKVIFKALDLDEDKEELTDVSIKNRLPERIIEQMKSKDSEFDSINVKANIGNGKVNYRGSLVIDEFVLSALGYVSFDQQIDFKGNYVFSKELTDLIKGIKTPEVAPNIENPPQAEPQERDLPPEKVILENVLDAIFN